MISLPFERQDRNFIPFVAGDMEGGKTGEGGNCPWAYKQRGPLVIKLTLFNMNLYDMVIKSDFCTGKVQQCCTKTN